MAKFYKHIAAILLLIGIATQGFSAAYADPVTDKNYNQSVARCTTVENGPRGTKLHGSGTVFAVNYNGKLGFMTAWHVAKDSIDNSVYVNNVKIGPFKQLNGADVAWAEFNTKNWKPLQFSKKVEYVGIDCWTIGIPGSRATDIDSFKCKVTGYSTIGKYTKNLTVNGYAVPGMSGGPVVDANGHVFAIVSHTNRNHTENYPAIIP